ncbi:peroxiredoxin-2-like isoform X2 [Paramacrobiotus metropolitanus]|uniref:peroxiredoxin-2-like isoform X2 n=1 Tax=Paramacrobiotus metropolitanus TaxID=2943436 RepID=UPI002445BA1F|nr:peroxiredoxin-2-like isoform X2 [Paramacrobiotus metropolitanus]
MSFENPRLHIGELAPDFTAVAVVNGEFTDVKLSSFHGKYVVLLFYPADFTFVCPTELIAYSEKLKEFKKIHCELLGMSCDSQYSHLAWLNTPRKEGGLGGAVKYPLLADHNASIAKKYGCYCFAEGNAFRALYIIDGNGMLRHISINDMPVGRNVEETLRLVQAFQFTDENGMVCPAGWKPGDDAMDADPEKSKEYFARVSTKNSNPKIVHPPDPAFDTTLIKKPRPSYPHTALVYSENSVRLTEDSSPKKIYERMLTKLSF